VIIRHRDGSYEIEFANLHDNLQSEANAFVITDDNVLREWGSAVEGKTK
jgi:hypothetical protein